MIYFLYIFHKNLYTSSFATFGINSRFACYRRLSSITEIISPEKTRMSYQSVNHSQLTYSRYFSTQRSMKIN